MESSKYSLTIHGGVININNSLESFTLQPEVSVHHVHKTIPIRRLHLQQRTFLHVVAIELPLLRFVSHSDRTHWFESTKIIARSCHICLHGGHLIQEQAIAHQFKAHFVNSIVCSSQLFWPPTSHPPSLSIVLLSACWFLFPNASYPRGRVNTRILTTSRSFNAITALNLQSLGIKLVFLLLHLLLSSFMAN